MSSFTNQSRAQTSTVIPCPWHLTQEVLNQVVVKASKRGNAQIPFLAGGCWGEKQDTLRVLTFSDTALRLITIMIEKYIATATKPVKKTIVKALPPTNPFAGFCSDSDDEEDDETEVPPPVTTPTTYAMDFPALPASTKSIPLKSTPLKSIPFKSTPTKSTPTKTAIPIAPTWINAEGDGAWGDSDDDE